MLAEVEPEAPVLAVARVSAARLHRLVIIRHHTSNSAVRRAALLTRPDRLLPGNPAMRPSCSTLSFNHSFNLHWIVQSTSLQAPCELAYCEGRHGGADPAQLLAAAVGVGAVAQRLAAVAVPGELPVVDVCPTPAAGYEDIVRPTVGVPRPGVGRTQLGLAKDGRAVQICSVQSTIPAALCRKARSSRSDPRKASQCSTRCRRSHCTDNSRVQFSSVQPSDPPLPADAGAVLLVGEVGAPQLVVAVFACLPVEAGHVAGDACEVLEAAARGQGGVVAGVLGDLDTPLPRHPSHLASYYRVQCLLALHTEHRGCSILNVSLSMILY